MKPAFTISIPTFNRCDILIHTLSSVCALAEVHQIQTGQTVEVLCIDNASTDNTEHVVNACQQRYQFLRYIKNERNIGLIQNIRKAIVSARGDYVWTLGDDDYPAPWCMALISKMLAYAKNNNFDCPFHLYSFAYSDPQFRLGIQRHKTQHTRTLHPGCSILGEESIHGIALISRWVFSRNHWDDNYFNEIYRDTDIYTFVTIMIRASLRSPALVIPAPISIASDRGSRKYYHYRTSIARVVEFPEIENLVLLEYGFKQGSKFLAAERKGWLRDRLPFVVKLNLLRSEYPQVQSYLQNPISSFKLERYLLGLIYSLTQVPLINSYLMNMYRKHREKLGD